MLKYTCYRGRSSAGRAFEWHSKGQGFDPPRLQFGNLAEIQFFSTVMAIRNILRIGHPVLRKVAEPVPQNEIGSKEIKKLIRDMFETMIHANGLGLAAPQIGVSKQIVVIGYEKSDRYPDSDDTMVRQVLINPKIKHLGNELSGFWEGCLSVPDMRGFVERPRKIQLSWFDENEKFHDETIDGFNAVVYQHECDHLNGILYVDRLKDPKLFGFNDELELAQDSETGQV